MEANPWGIVLAGGQGTRLQWEEARFLGYVRRAIEAADRFRDRLVVLGVEADGPEQSYGWIAPGSPCEIGGGAELYQVRRFWEKPDRPTAARLFASGYPCNAFAVPDGCRYIPARWRLGPSIPDRHCGAEGPRGGQACTS